MLVVKRVCHKAGCNNITEKGNYYCNKHINEKTEKVKRYNKNRYETSPERRKFYNSKAWKNLAKLKKIEQGCCQQCGSIENLEAHHEIPTDTKDGWERRLDPDIIVILCRRCHEKVEDNPNLLRHNKKDKWKPRI